MFGLGTGELLIIAAIVFLLFGAKRLPALGGSLAQSIKNFQSGITGKEVKQKVTDEENKNS